MWFLSLEAYRLTRFEILFFGANFNLNTLLMYTKLNLLLRLTVASKWQAMHEH